MNKTEKERRAVPRIPLKMRVVLKSKKSAEEFVSDYSENLSINGIFLVTNAKFDIGTMLELHFSLPNSKQLLKVDGRVIWTTSKLAAQKGVGVEFTHLSNEAKEIITQYVERTTK